MNVRPGRTGAGAGIITLGGSFIGIGTTEASRQAHIDLWGNTWFVAGVSIVAFGLLIILSEALESLARDRARTSETEANPPLSEAHSEQVKRILRSVRDSVTRWQHCAYLDPQEINPDLPVFHEAVRAHCGDLVSLLDAWDGEVTAIEESEAMIRVLRFQEHENLADLVSHEIPDIPMSKNLADALRWLWQHGQLQQVPLTQIEVWEDNDNLYCALIPSDHDAGQGTETTIFTALTTHYLDSISLEHCVTTPLDDNKRETIKNGLFWLLHNVYPFFEDSTARINREEERNLTLDEEHEITFKKTLDALDFTLAKTSLRDGRCPLC